MGKFLDNTGLATLWAKIKSLFALKTDVVWARGEEGSTSIVAKGHQVKSPKAYGVATGYLSVSGFCSAAFGQLANALGNSSLAVGHQTVARGGWALASGQGEFIAITGVTWTLKASTSTAWTYTCSGSVPSSIAIGTILAASSSSSPGNNPFKDDSTVIGRVVSLSGSDVVVDQDLGTIASLYVVLGISNGHRSAVFNNRCCAVGDDSFASGRYTIAFGGVSHAEGISTYASGLASHAEGTSTTHARDRGISYLTSDADIIANWTASDPDTDKFSFAKGEAAHVEGNNCLALGDHSHAEGNGTIAGNNSSHAEGTGSKAIGKYAHAEGLETEAEGSRSHTEGAWTKSIKDEAHAEGQYSEARARASHAEGYKSITSIEGYESNTLEPHAQGTDTSSWKNACSHAEGNACIAQGIGAHAEGEKTFANNRTAHAEGLETVANGDYASHAEGYQTDALGGYGSHSEGDNTTAKGGSSHAEGEQTLALGSNSHAEGYKSKTGGADESNTLVPKSDEPGGYAAHAEGNACLARGAGAHAEGKHTFAKGNNSHTEGQNTQAIKSNCHAEGESTIANTWASHAEGYNCETGGNASSNTKTPDTDHVVGEMAHAEGNSTLAKGNSSHTEGIKTFAQNEGEHAEGKYNKSNTNTISSVGIGTSDSDRKNAFEIMQNGDVYIFNVNNYQGTSIDSTKSLQTFLAPITNAQIDSLF